MNLKEMKPGETTRVNAVGFGYGKIQDVADFSWASLKKALMASHKTSDYSKVKFTKFTPLNFGTTDGKTWAAANIEYEVDGQKDPSVRGRVWVNLSEKGITIKAQTRYNQV